mmetsp:Transcript_2493/g.2944  ORF Transcript_2493/g.2944 Transcript_2493/m.2944 type:complete len:101 (+) Transcript_2493:181-483(+)
MLSALQQAHTEALPAVCGGGDPEVPAYQKPTDSYSQGPMCNTCKVEIPLEWNSKVPKTAAETFQIEHDPHYIASTTRLSCCIQMEKWMDGMIIQIGHNIE